MCPGFGSLAQRGLGLPPPAALPSPAPSLRVSGRPPLCSPLGGWVPRCWGARASPSTGRAGPRPRPAGLPPVHLAANATSGTVRLSARCPASVCLRVQSRGSVCPHRRRTEQGRRQSYVRRGGRGGRGGGGAERGSGGAGGGEARRAGDSGGRRRHAASPFAHRGLRRPQHGREARRPVSPRAQPAGQTADSGRGAAPWAEPRAGARAGGHRRCCCFWGLRWCSLLGPRRVGTDRYRDPSGSGAPPWARVPLASGARGVRELCQGGGAAACPQLGRGKGRTRRCGDLLEATRRPPPECGDRGVGWGWACWGGA